MKHTTLSIFLTTMLASAVLAADAWQAKDALFRLSAPARQNAETRLFIPTPQPADGKWSCSAFNSEGAQGVVAAIELDGAAIGFRVVVPPTKTIGKYVHIYFSKAVSDAKPPAPPDDERPFRVTRNVRTVTTRAFTADEIMRYFGEVQQSAQTSHVANAGEIPANDRWNLPKKTHIAALLQWETLFVAEEDMELSFGSKQPNIAWAMLVDGNPVADWHASEPEKEGWFCRPVKLGKGLHTFQMLAIQRVGETLPQALTKDAKGVRQLKGISSPDFPQDIALEYNDSAKTASRTTRDWPSAFGSVTVLDSHGVGASVAFAKATAENAEFIGLDGKALPIHDGILAWNASFAPGVRLGTISFNARRRFTPARQVFIRPRITNAPNVIANAKGIELSIAIDAAKEADAILKNATATLSYCDKDGRLDVPSLSVPLDGRRTISISSAPMSSFDGRLPSSIEISICMLDEKLPFALPARLRLVHPKDDAVAELSANGTILYHDGVPAVLVCSKLPKAPLGTRKGTANGHCRKVVLLDAFTEDVFAPQASKPLDALLAAKLPTGVECSLVTVERAAGTSYNTSMLASFGKIMADRPDAAVLLDGVSSSKGFATPLEAAAATLFMAQSCLEHGILPILAAMPKLTGADTSATRFNALYLKEMATALGLPVMDFYSMDIMGTAKAGQWYLYSTKGTAATPKDDAREWIATQLSKEIIQLTNSDK